MKRSHSLIASPSSSSTPKTNYKVFLSFRGRDTRKNFASPLYEALCAKKIHTFFDGDGLQKGGVISTGLRKAIEGSRCSVVILSPDYASSRWCLDELVLILQCRKESKQIVLPIFYHVDPSHVRNQTGSFGEAFKRHEQVHKLEEVNSWRAALTEVGNLAGYHLQDDGNEANFREDFVEVVSSKLVPVVVGMDSRLAELKLRVSSSPFEDVCFIGICGMKGIGKTTLARAYFEDMSCQFEASSFLANVKEVCENNLKKGLVELQKQLLRDILKREHAICDVDQGIGIIQTRLYRKKVLVVLDDVDQVEQLQGLAEKNHWFGRGSRIILTTRDKQLVKSMYKKNEYILHKVEKLNYSQALELFSFRAFESDFPPKDYRELSEKVVEYANCLPLALEVLGSFLGSCESIDEWKSTWERLKKYPKEEIMKTLQVSFGALEEIEKNIFLDIACFFNGYSKDFIMNIMDSCGFFPENGIRSLVDKSPLHMDHDSRLRTHDLLEEMGKDIVRKESRNEPGRRSRIWSYKDLCHVMNNDTATKEVEAIVCQRLEEPEEILSMRGFSYMKKLRLLIFSSAFNWRGGENLEHLSNELRFLEWNGFPFNSFPPSFQPHGLVELKLRESKIKQLWNKQPLYCLESIDLSHSSIEKLEGFRYFPNVEKLILDHSMLEEIDPSITVLKRLTLLSLDCCRSLKSLPTSMNGLESLKVLKLSGCSSLGNLPDLGCLYNLEELDVRATGIRDNIPTSIGDLKALKSLHCNDIFLGSRGWKNILNTSAGLYCLEKLDLRNCGLRDGAFPDDFGCLDSLEYLDLSRNNFSCLPAHFNRLSKLRDLNLTDCRNLTSLGPELPDSLESVTVDDCLELHAFLDPLSPCNLRCSAIFCGNCDLLVKRQGSKRTAITSLGRYLQNHPSPGKRFDIVLPGYEIPAWFTRQVWGSSISLPLHQNWCTNEWLGFALSVCFVNEYFEGSSNFIWQIKINQEGGEFGDVHCIAKSFMRYNHHHWLLYLPRTYFHTEWHNKLGAIQFSFKSIIDREKSKEFIQCDVRMVYEQDIEELNLHT